MKLVFLDKGDRMYCVHDAKSDSHIAAMTCDKGNKWVVKYGEEGDDVHEFNAVNVEAAKAYVTKWLETLEEERTKTEGKFPAREFKSYAHQQLVVVGALAAMFDREAAFTEACLEQIAFNVSQIDEEHQTALMTQIVKEMYSNLKAYNEAKAERAKRDNGLRGMLGGLLGVIVQRSPGSDEDGPPVPAPKEKSSTKLH